MKTRDVQYQMDHTAIRATVQRGGQECPMSSGPQGYKGPGSEERKHLQLEYGEVSGRTQGLS